MQSNSKSTDSLCSRSNNSSPVKSIEGQNFVTAATAAATTVVIATTTTTTTTYYYC